MTDEVDQAVARLQEIFEKAKVVWFENFKFDISTEDWLKKSDSRYGIQKYMGFLIELMNLDYYERSLKQKSAELYLKMANERR